jgi:hypothetical protein
MGLDPFCVDPRLAPWALFFGRSAGLFGPSNFLFQPSYF